MRTYKQLTSGQRYQISALKKIGYGPSKIAKELEVHKSTISRELSRNMGERGYRPKQANEKAIARRTQAANRKRISAETWEVVEEKLRQDWSPEQVSGWLEKCQAVRISPEWIYQYILTEKQAGVTYTLICGNIENAASAMASMSDVVNCQIGSVLKSVHNSLSNANVWETGKLTPWLAKDTAALW